MAIGGLLFSLQPSQDVSFLQEIKIPAAKMNNTGTRNIDIMKKEEDSFFIYKIDG